MRYRLSAEEPGACSFKICRIYLKSCQAMSNPIWTMGGADSEPVMIYPIV